MDGNIPYKFYCWADPDVISFNYVKSTMALVLICPWAFVVFATRYLCLSMSLPSLSNHILLSPLVLICP